MGRLRMLVVAGAIAWGCAGPKKTGPAEPAPEARGETAMSTTETTRTPGLQFRLGEGADDAAPRDAVHVATAARLTDDRAKAVLDRLPPMEADPGAETGFAMRTGSLPPPRAGATVQAAFPPAAERPAPEASAPGPLDVLRRAPEGEVPLAPHLQVTFSQPMVAVTSHADLARQEPPVRLVTQPPGQWRWIGTRTVLFEPEGRFPMATDYEVEVPAGTRSATGGALAQAATWRFSTPPPTLVGSHPVEGPERRDVVMFVEFDQRIDPQAVMGSIRVTAGGRAVPLRPASADEVAAEEKVRRLAERAIEGRWVAFRSVEPLPGHAAISVSVEPGAPSAEGPRKTERAQTFGFRTYGPMAVVSSRCGWRDECPPGTSWEIEFTNPIDMHAFAKTMVRVEPELRGLQATAYGHKLMQIHGRSRARTTYRVTLSSAIPDQFGQTLGEDQTVVFRTTAANPALHAQGGPLVVLDPSGPPRFPVYSVGHRELRVRLHAVEPADWEQFIEYLRRLRQGGEAGELPGRRVVSTTVAVSGDPDETAETAIDLSPALREGLGQAIVVVEPPPGTEARWARRIVVAWVQVTRIGVDAFVDDSDLHAWATSLADGTPLEGVDLSILPAGRSARTGGDGTARLPLDDRPGRVLVARKGTDVALLPESTSWWSAGGAGWRREVPGRPLRFYVFDDRKMYRPGEEAKVKGWVRRVGLGKDGDVEAAGMPPGKVAWTLLDPRGNELAKGEAAVGTLGGFDFAVRFPDATNLGTARLTLEAQGQQHHHMIQVQEFRRPEFEVTSQASEGPHFPGGRVDVTVTASYYAGGGLPNADLTWRVTSRPGRFTPPGRDDFSFGSWTPWWMHGGPPEDPRRTRTEAHAARTDSAGKHRLRIDLGAVDPPRPMSLTAEATVMDVNRQAWAAKADLLIHPGALYVGLRGTRAFVREGESLHVEAIVADLDGKAVAGREIAVRAVRLQWEQKGDDWEETEVDPSDCGVRSADGPVTCTFRPREGGSYRVTASVADDAGRKNETEIRLWVAGGQAPPRRGIDEDRVTLIPDRKEYRAGETAEVLVLAPFAPAEGLMTVRRSGILRTERFSMSGATHTLRVPIDEAFVPNVHVQVHLAGAVERTTDDGEPDPHLPRRPAHASGSVDLPVPPRERTLRLDVRPCETRVEPGGGTEIVVEVRDPAGRPVIDGEVAVVVVDEAVLSLTGYRLPDPLDVFYAARRPGGRDYRLRQNLLLAAPTVLQQGEGREGGGDRTRSSAMPGAMPPPAPMRAMLAPGAPSEDRGQAAPPPIRMRTDFAALALFAPALRTDSSGTARVSVVLPDNLTRYRVMAVAVAGTKQFGSGESTITARLPLMVRPSPPRFLNFGDRFELPVVLQNQTDRPMDVEVAVRAANAALTDGQGRRVTIPADDRVEVRFPAAAVRAGTARFQVGAVSGRWSDAAQFRLPVWTPATAEAFATYGQIDRGAIAQPVRAPDGVFAEFGGLEVTTSSTALQALTDAVLYLHEYPFDCAEQLASRVMGLAALRDVLAAFRTPELPPPDEIAATVRRDAERLARMQNADGGFPVWQRGDPSWPYISIHVAHALRRAVEKGFDVPADAIGRSLGYLRDIERHIPAWYGEEVRRTLVAYSLAVRKRIGDPDPARAKRLLREAGLERLPLEATGWLLQTLAGDPAHAAETAAIRRHLGNRAVETA
ncbi:MAG: alpha-2-macroglobulin family protein, partial [Myxococcota bacterium]|nr:alpha-2-macroglobulin family protein [Myxococcota bacterium]